MLTQKSESGADGRSLAARPAEVAEVSASLLSHHLKVLRDAGSIAGARRGRWIDCTLDRAALVRLADALEPPTESVP